jgi:formylglycine-generating enzyme required for sulfatase activity
MAKNYFWLAALVLVCFASGVAAQISSGTTFAVAPGLLITNQHVVDGCSSIEVIAADGRRTGSVVDADAQLDLALLRVSGLKGPTARLRNPRNVRLGESVMVFGFPLAGSLTSGGNFTSGLVSGLRGLRDAAGELQITAPVQPGNSGGPLLDASGLVIGVVQAKLDALRSAIVTGDIPQNVNFAISLEVLADFLAKNKVPFRDGTPSSALDTARVAELAQTITYRVECRGRSRQAAAYPSPNSKPPRAEPSGPSFKDCDECPEMVVIPPGNFTMGWTAEEKHTVSFTRAFAVGKFEVTFDQWKVCVDDGGCSHRPANNGWGEGRQPVVDVSWVDAKQYTQWLSGKTRNNYRLLTDAEWEYVARAATLGKFYWGDDYSVICQYETVNRGVVSCGNSKPSPVGEHRPNPFGVFDMLGNVWEWVEDCRNAKLVGAPSDGSAWLSGDCNKRIFRGGNWDTKVKYDLWALRWKNSATVRNANLGFRVAKSD